MNTPKANPEKKLTIKIKDKEYYRFPIKTHVIKKEDNLFEIVKKYTKNYLQKNDLIFISEKIVAITQGRSFPIKDIKPSKLAKFLCKFVHKSKYGIGIGSPWTMELAIKEAGILRLLFAAFISATTKPFGLKGVFYKIAGRKVAAIDGPCDYTIPPYNKYAKFGPAKPNKVAKELKDKLNHEIIIIDANDLGVDILGKSNKELNNDFLKALFKDNPLGQSTEQTPIAIIREKLEN